MSFDQGKPISVVYGVKDHVATLKFFSRLSMSAGTGPDGISINRIIRRTIVNRSKGVYIEVHDGNKLLVGFAGLHCLNIG